MPQSNIIYPFNNAVLHDYDGDLSKRWNIQYWVFDLDLEKKVRQIIWIPTSQKTVRQRKDWSKEYILRINQLLAQGYALSKKTKPIGLGVNLTVHSKLTDCLDEALKIKINNAKALVSKKDRELNDATKNKGGNTIRTYKSSKNVVFDWLRSDGLENITIREFCFDERNEQQTKYVYFFRDYLLEERENSARTANNVIAHLRSLLNELKGRKIISFNPASNTPRLPTQHGRNVAFRKEDKIKLITDIKDNSKELYLFVCFIYYCYIRPDEIRFLKIKNILKNQIYVDSSISKNNRSEYVLIPDHFNEIIDSLGLRLRHPESYIFFRVTVDNKQIHWGKNYFYRQHEKFLEKLKLGSDFTLYSWKHTGVCDAHDENVPIDYLRQQLRHTSLETTQNYLKSLGLVINLDITKKFPKLI